MLDSKGFRRWPMTLIIAFLAMLLSMGLVACAPRGHLQSGTGTYTVGNQVTQPPQQSAQTARPSSQVQNCGVVIAYGTLETVPQDGDVSARMENCFWQAFQDCRPATLVFTTGGIAAKTSDQMFTRTFTVKETNGTCSLSDMLQRGKFPDALQPATAIYTCTGLKHLTNALEMLSCGRDGTVTVLGT